MFDETPANQNISLSSLIRNPKRELAETEIATLLTELEEFYEIPSPLLAEVLFEFLMGEMEPDDPVTSEKAITRFAKLQRFRDALQAKIDQIESLYEDAPL